jgi:hypothetical protein
VENFEAWQTILKSGIKSQDELIWTYHYWKHYNEQFGKYK